MLHNIIKQQKIDMANQENFLPFDALLKQLKPSIRNFIGALQNKFPFFIFECKQHSPSEGKLTKEYNCGKLAKSYAQFADTISVLTNAPFFGGDFEHLKKVSESIDKPVLCKDIIVNPYQVALARFYGADAVLLMLSVLSDNEYIKCRHQAQVLNMTVLTEVFSETEAIRARQLQASIIVINHRNLHTMQLDMMRVKYLKPFFHETCILIAASGIQTNKQIQALAPHVNGFLIGSCLSKSQNIELTMRELIFGNIKICGLTRKQDAKKAFESGACFGGMIFADESSRKISLQQALKIKAIPLQYIGVFTNQTIDKIIFYAKTLQLYAVQLYGYSHDLIATLRKLLEPYCQIWLAINGNEPLPSIMPLYVDKLVVDNMSKQQGGTGLAFDWNNIIDSPLLEHMVLAGGLSPINIHIAKRLNTWGLDINSGIEINPGIKDHRLIDSLFAQLKTIGEHHAK
jgi:indole-3-glycerol phosphate synthase/phosphoribosylanthranilate isomerase